MNLRGRFRTGLDGRYEFRSVKPKSYPVPDDGPVGVLLRAQGGIPYRPAHIHFIVTADGHEPLDYRTVYRGDVYIESDAVFGAKHSLTVDYHKSRAASGRASARRTRSNSISRSRRPPLRAFATAPRGADAPAQSTSDAIAPSASRSVRQYKAKILRKDGQWPKLLSVTRYARR